MRRAFLLFKLVNTDSADENRLREALSKFLSPCYYAAPEQVENLSFNAPLIQGWGCWSMPTEPCPFCGARVVPRRIGDMKQCPSCGGRWFESGGGIGEKYYDAGGGGGAEVAAAC